MSATGTLIISGGVVGGVSGNKRFSPPTITSTDACLEVLSQPLASGDNVITPPAKAKGVIMTPPVGNTVVLKLKGAAGDTGIILHLTDSLYLPLTTPSATFIINAASVITGIVEFSFI